MKRLLLLFTFLTFLMPAVWAGVFTSSDGQFTIDMPAGWMTAPDTQAVLGLKKGTAEIIIRTDKSCKTESCLEQKITQDLASVKAKKMKVIGNTYTGEDIKRIDFSTGEPFFYISYFSPKADFSSGYFLVNSTAYSILAKNLSYAETDLIFSFIYPAVKKAKTAAPKPAAAQDEDFSLNMDLQDPRAYDIAAAPQVEETSLLPEPSAGQKQPQAKAPAQPAAKQAPAARRYAHALKTRLAQWRPHTLVTDGMPPYIRRAGHAFDVFILLLALYLGVLGASCVVRWFVPAKKNLQKVNPNSLYPLKFKRLYGTPSLIFRARDNQGNTIISLSARWDSLFLFTGAAVAVLALTVMAVAGVLQTTDLLPVSAFAYNTLYSAASLAIPLGLLVFFCGVVWSQLMLREITLYDRRGQKAVFVLQKGFGLFKECYEIYFAKSKDVILLERKRWRFYRQWAMRTKEGHWLADITEDNRLKAVLRKPFGHLWGLLRASYRINGQMDSVGEISNACTAFDFFTCNLDKPQAIEARDMLAAALVINIRDKDKWYPWFN